MSDFEPTNQHIKELHAHEAKRSRLGKEKYQELLRLKDKSSVPLAFHLGLLLSLPLNVVDYQAGSIIFRLSGLQYPDFKSSRYAILYAQAMSLIKIVNSQKLNENIWPVNLYTTSLLDYSRQQSVCADLALEESMDYAYWIKPPLTLKLDDLIKRITRTATGSFNPGRIVSDVESSFLDPNTVSKLNSLVRLKLQQSGMPRGW